MAETIACPSCRAENARAQRFCGACGAALAARCAGCGAENPPGFRFCGSCGAALAAAAAAPPAPEAAPAPAAAERRVATVLFADLSGFTALSERTDPEEVRTIADACARRLGDIVARYDGHVDKVIGDAVMAVFGAPRAHEDDPERAVRAALDMLACAREHAAEFGDLPLRIGVNSGEVMFAPVGSGGAHTVIGDAVNTAARLQAAAPRDGVLVGRSTWRACRDAIRFEPIGAVAAKGKEAGIEAWRAVGAEAPPATRVLSRSRFVGREGELALLAGVAERALRDRRPHMVTVLGPPGIGKSRLALELTTQLDAAGVRTWKGRSLPYGENTGFGAFAEQVRLAAALAGAAGPAEARAALDAHVRALLPDADADDVAPHLARLVGLHHDAAAPGREHLFLSARRYVEALARAAPTCLLFEDVHWADASLRELVHELAGRVRDVPLLVICLARADLLERHAGWGGGLLAHTALALEPLPAEAARALVARDFAAAGDEAIERLVQTAGGNPLFLEELAATMAERTGEAAAALPTSVSAIIAARLDGLPADARRLVGDAAVQGRSFWRGGLVAMGWEPAAADRALDALARREIVRRDPASRLPGDAEFTFKHILTREVAYGMLPKAARRRGHSAVAAWLATATGARAREWATLVAHHHREAGERDAALRFLALAAEAAGDAAALAEAVAICGQALELLRDGGDPAAVQAWRLRRAQVRLVAGEIAAAAAEFDELLPPLTGLPRARVLIERARAGFWLADAAGTMARATEARALATEAGDVALEAAAAEMVGEGAGMAGEIDRAIGLVGGALDRWPAAARDADPHYPYAVRSLGQLLHWRGDAAPALAHLHRAFDLAMERQLLRAALSAGSDVGVALAGAGRHEEAMAWLARVVAMGIDWRANWRDCARALAIWGGALRDVGDVAAARERSERALALGRDAGFPGAIVSAQLDLAVLDLDVGEPGRAGAALPALREATTGTKGWHQWLWEMRLAVLEADVHRAHGRFPDAIASATAAHAIAARAPRRKYMALADLVRGAALREAGRPAEAVAPLQAALASARGGHPPTVWRVAGELARARAAAGDDAGAAEAATQARAAIDAFAAGLSPDRASRFLDAEPIRALRRG